MITEKRKKTLENLFDEKSKLIAKRHELTKEIWMIDHKEQEINELLKKYGKDQNHIRENNICG